MPPIPGPDGVGYHRPGTHRYDDGELAPHPWPEANGYHLEDPAPPVVNGYRLDEPVAPVTGFPYTAPPMAPTAYPLNGHGVDAAERDAVAWPVNGNATARAGRRGHRTELDRSPDPQIAVVPLNDEPTEVLDRPAPKPAAGTPSTPSHPPRAVVRRRRARRKALEWPFLIVFAVVSAFLIRQYVANLLHPVRSMDELSSRATGCWSQGRLPPARHPPRRRGRLPDAADLPTQRRGPDQAGGRAAGRDRRGPRRQGVRQRRPAGRAVRGAACHGTGEFAKVTVPAGTLWVMGDNRCNSSDSRVFGPISQKLLVGRAFVIAWPFDRLSWL